jgi:hypothetical protein
MHSGAWQRLLGVVALAALAGVTRAGVLPEDRADVLFHSYDGGGVTIQGPSLLVRKQFAGKFSASANYYVDNVSSASIDVVTSGASKYEEERTQYSLGLDYLRDRWLFNLGLSKSSENDFEAETVSVGISQYLLTYRANNRNKGGIFHHIRVEVPYDKLEVRHRPGYFYGPVPVLSEEPSETESQPEAKQDKK